MPPPPRQQTGYDRALALRVLELSDPEAAQRAARMQTLLETQTPAQAAQFQQRYADATPVPGLAGLSDPNAPVADVPPGGTTIQVPRNPEMLQRNEGLQRRSVMPARQYGGVPGGGGDATFADTTTPTETGTAVVNPALYPPEDPETGALRARTTGQGGASSRLQVGPLDPAVGGARVRMGDQEGVIPAEWFQSPERFQLELDNAIRRGSAGAEGGGIVDITDPQNIMLDSNAADTLRRQLPSVLGQTWAAPAPGPGGPTLDATVTRDIVTPGRVTPETAARLEAAGLDTARGQGAYGAAQNALFAGHEAAGGVLGAEQEAAALEQAAQAQEHAQHLERATQTLQRRIDDVAGRRVSVEDAFGGFGGRIGAGIAVALGQIGSALGGGDNAALGIVNSMIDRNLRAQESNIQNERAGVAMAGNALAQMRQVFSDEEAAQQAARSMHLTAVASQLNGMLAGLSGNSAESVRNLQRLMLQESQVARQAALEIESTTSRARVSSRVRGPADRVLGEIGRLSGVSPAQPTEPAASGGGTGAGGGRSGGGAARVRPGTVMTPEQALEASTESAEANAPPSIPGLTSLRTDDGQIDPSAERQQRAANGDPETMRRVHQLAAESRLWGNWAQQIVRANETYNAELTNGERPVAAARQMANILRMITRHEFTGAAFTEAERQDFLEMMPEPGDITPENLSNAWESFANVWGGLSDAMLQRYRAELGSWGYQVDGGQFMSPRMRALIAEHQRGQTPQPPEQGIELPSWLISPAGAAGVDFARRAYRAGRQMVEER